MNLKILIIAVILLSFATALFFWPKMPETMASHWNIRGEVDGHMPKFWGLFLMPLISLLMFLFFIFLPKIDPMKENIDKFRKYFDGFVLLIMIFLFYVYFLTLFWNLGIKFDLGRMIMPAMAVLFFFAGILTEKSKRNWFIGIKTPWTLSSDLVWDKTHKLGGILFKTSGLIALIGFFLPSWSFWLVIGPIFLAVFSTVLYSYFEFQKIKK